jgi:hypothetical protein
VFRDKREVKDVDNAIVIHVSVGVEKCLTRFRAEGSLNDVNVGAVDYSIVIDVACNPGLL